MARPNKAMADAIIADDFRFLESVKIHNVDGSLMLGDEELPYNVSKVMTEEEFVRDWLMGFALGNSLGINYFNSAAWLSFTNNGTRAVMIVDDKDKTKPLVVVRPLIAHNLTQNEIAVLRRLNERLHSLSGDTMNGANPHASLGLARGVGEMLEGVERLTLTAMIPAEFYEKHGINPEAEQKVYYTKDILNEGRRPIEDINKLRPIFYKLEKGESITKEEKAFVSDITLNNFVFNNQDDNVNTEQVKETAPNQDPFSC